MKRKQTEIEIRLRSNKSFLLLGKSNKNYYISFYKIQENKFVCKSTVKTNYQKAINKNQRIQLLLTLFEKRILPMVKGEELVLRIIRKKITNVFFGKEIVKGLLQMKILLTQGITDNK